MENFINKFQREACDYGKSNVDEPSGWVAASHRLQLAMIKY